MDSYSNLYAAPDPMDDKRFKETEDIIQKQIERSQNILEDQLAKTAALIERQIERARSFLEQKDFDVKVLNEEVERKSIVETITVHHNTNFTDVSQEKTFTGSSLQPVTNKAVNVSSLNGDKTYVDLVTNFADVKNVEQKKPIREVTPDKPYSDVHVTTAGDENTDRNVQLENRPWSYTLTNKDQYDDKSYTHDNHILTHVDHSSNSEKCDVVAINDSSEMCSLSASNHTLENITTYKHCMRLDNCILSESRPTMNCNTAMNSSHLRCPQQQRLSTMKDSSTSTTDLLKYVTQSKSSSYSSGEELTSAVSAMPVDSETDAVSTSHDYSSISFDTVIFNNRSRKNTKFTEDAVASSSDNATSSSTKTESRDISSLSCEKAISKDEDVNRVTYGSKLGNVVEPVISGSESYVTENKKLITCAKKEEVTVLTNSEHNDQQSVQREASLGNAKDKSKSAAISNNSAESAFEIRRNIRLGDNKALETKREELSSADLKARTEIEIAKPAQVIGNSVEAKQEIQERYLDGRTLKKNTLQSQTKTDKEENDSFYDDSQTRVDKLEERKKTFMQEETTNHKVEEKTPSPKLYQAVIVESKIIPQSSGSEKINNVEHLSVNEEEITRKQIPHGGLNKDFDTDLAQEGNETCSSEKENLCSSDSGRKLIDSSIKIEKCIHVKRNEIPNTYIEKPVIFSGTLHDTSTQSEPIWDDGCSIPRDTSSFPIYTKLTLKRPVNEDTAVFSLSDDRKLDPRNAPVSGESQSRSSHLDDTESEPIWNFVNTKIKRTSSYPLLLKTTPKRITKDNSFPFWNSQNLKAKVKELKPMIKVDGKPNKKGHGFASSYPLNKFTRRCKPTDTKLKTFPIENEADDGDDTLSNTSFTEESVHFENPYELLGDEEVKESDVNVGKCLPETSENVMSENHLSDNKCYTVLRRSEGKGEEELEDQEIPDRPDSNAEFGAMDIKSHEKTESGTIVHYDYSESRIGKSEDDEYSPATEDGDKDDCVKGAITSFDKKNPSGLSSRPSVPNISKWYSKMRYVVDVAHNDDDRQTRSLTELVTSPKTEQLLSSKKNRRRSWSLSRQGSIPETSCFSSNISSGSSREKLISVCCPTGTNHREDGEECECVRVEPGKQNIPTEEFHLGREPYELTSPTNGANGTCDEELSGKLPRTHEKEKESRVSSEVEDLDSSYFERERYKATPSLDSTDLSFAFEESETSSLVSTRAPEDGNPMRSKISNSSAMYNEDRRTNSFIESDISVGNDNLSSSIIQFSSINASVEGSTEDIVVDESCRSYGSGNRTNSKQSSHNQPIPSTFSSTPSIISSKLAEDFVTTSDFTYDPLMDKISTGDVTDVEDTFLMEGDLDSTTISNRTDVLGTSSETVTQVENPAYDRQ